MNQDRKNSITAYRGLVRGIVQGVFFRAETQKQAHQLGIKGWVRNVPDGSVEFLICGDANNVEAMCRWLNQGPPRARVDAVDLQAVEIDTGPAGFEITR